MPNPPSRAREVRSWFAAALWSLVIFATIPLAKTIQEAVEGAWGDTVFLVFVLAAGAGATVVAARILARNPVGGVARRLWLLVVASVFAAATWALRGNPEEAVHFVEYGVLGWLLYRALRHRVCDVTIYPAAALLAAIVGTVDEAIQWLTPGRYWALRDVWLNVMGAGLALAAIAGAVPPRDVARPAARASVRRLLAIGAALVVLLTLSMANTPPRIAHYSASIPALAFARATSGPMFEYGHRYDDAEIGRFRSRFAPDELRALDAARGAEAGAILRAFAADERYGEFHAIYTPVTDPFVHEARVHVFRRDHILALVEDRPDDREWRRWHVTTAYRENLILERWFPQTLAAAGVALAPAVRERLVREQDPAFPFESRVSAELVTAAREPHVLAGMLGLLAALALAWWAARD